MVRLKSHRMNAITSNWTSQTPDEIRRDGPNKVELMSCGSRRGALDRCLNRERFSTLPLLAGVDPSVPSFHKKLSVGFVDRAGSTIIFNLLSYLTLDEVRDYLMTAYDRRHAILCLPPRHSKAWTCFSPTTSWCQPDVALIDIES